LELTEEIYYAIGIEGNESREQEQAKVCGEGGGVGDRWLLGRRECRRQ
jgi:hypothetical protein